MTPNKIEIKIKDFLGFKKQLDEATFRESNQARYIDNLNELIKVLKSKNKNSDKNEEYYRTELEILRLETDLYYAAQAHQMYAVRKKEHEEYLKELESVYYENIDKIINLAKSKLDDVRIKKAYDYYNSSLDSTTENILNAFVILYNELNR